MRPEARKNLFRKFLSLFFAGVSFIFGLLFMTTPVATSSYSYSWNPTEVNQSGAFPLDRWWPQQLSISFTATCSIDEKIEIFSSGQLEISCEDGQIKTNSKSVELTPLPVQSGDRVTLSFDGDMGLFSQTNSSLGIERTDEVDYANYPQFQSLRIFDTRNELSLDLVTRPAEVSFDITRASFGILSLLSAVSAVIISQSWTRKKGSSHE